MRANEEIETAIALINSELFHFPKLLECTGSYASGNALRQVETRLEKIKEDLHVVKPDLGGWNRIDPESPIQVQQRRLERIDAAFTYPLDRNWNEVALAARGVELTAGAFDRVLYGIEALFEQVRTRMQPMKQPYEWATAPTNTVLSDPNTAEELSSLAEFALSIYPTSRDAKEAVEKLRQDDMRAENNLVENKVADSRKWTCVRRRGDDGEYCWAWEETNESAGATSAQDTVQENETADSSGLFCVWRMGDDGEYYCTWEETFESAHDVGTAAPETVNHNSGEPNFTYKKEETHNDLAEPVASNSSSSSSDEGVNVKLQEEPKEAAVDDGGPQSAASFDFDDEGGVSLYVNLPVKCEKSSVGKNEASNAGEAGDMPEHAGDRVASNDPEPEADKNANFKQTSAEEKDAPQQR